MDLCGPLLTLVSGAGRPVPRGRAADPEAALGQAWRIEDHVWTADRPAHHERPPEFGLSDTEQTPKFLVRRVLAPGEIPADEQYHWHYVGRMQATPTMYFYAHHSWVFDQRLFAAYNAALPEQKHYDAYISLKLEGPAYVPGSKRENAFSIDRLILVETSPRERLPDRIQVSVAFRSAKRRAFAERKPTLFRRRSYGPNGRWLSIAAGFVRIRPSVTDCYSMKHPKLHDLASDSRKGDSLMSSVALVFALLLAAESPPLQAGAATSNITPELGTLVVGGFAPYPAQHVHDELPVRCLVLDDGQTKLALVVCDLLGLHRSVSVEARRLIQEATGIPPQNVLISATHTHSAGTALGKSRYVNHQVLDDYQRFVARRIADGVRRAVNLLRPAEIAFGTVDVPEQVHNRRWRMREAPCRRTPSGKSTR